VDDISKILTGEAPSGGAIQGDLADSDSVLVSKKILAGSPILFVYRDRPEDDDSGWTLMAGDEPDSWLEDRDRFVEKTIGWALEHDAGLAAIIGAPPDTAFERDDPEGPWAELLEA
jgi:hypothetical protein